jgi:hypothetical protein
MTINKRRSDHLRDRFGDEYDRTVDSVGGRSDAERNLEERQKRVAEFDIRPLTVAERDRFAAEWKDVKALFVDSPAEAVLRGDRLLANMMDTRGYPMGDFDRRYEDLTVDHGTVARHYRDGHDIAVRLDELSRDSLWPGLQLCAREPHRPQLHDFDHDRPRHRRHHGDPLHRVLVRRQLELPERACGLAPGGGRRHFGFGIAGGRHSATREPLVGEARYCSYPIQHLDLYWDWSPARLCKEADQRRAGGVFLLLPAVHL